MFDNLLVTANAREEALAVFCACLLNYVGRMRKGCLEIRNSEKT